LPYAKLSFCLHDLKDEIAKSYS